MQNFIQKISQSKGKLLIGLGGAAIVGFLSYIYNQYKNEQTKQQQTSQVKKQEKPFDLSEQIKKFKQSHNVQNPNIEQLKQIIKFSLNLQFKQILRIQNDFKISRRLVKQQYGLKKYFKTVGVGLIRFFQIFDNLQPAILQQLGISNSKINYQQHAQQLKDFISNQTQTRILGKNDITLGQVKQIMRIQTQYVKEHGKRLTQQMIQNCKDWQIQAKKYIPDIFMIYLYDQVIRQNPHLDKVDMQGAQNRFKKYIQKEIQQMNVQLQPYIKRMVEEIGLYKVQSGQNKE